MTGPSTGTYAAPPRCWAGRASWRRRRPGSAARRGPAAAGRRRQATGALPAGLNHADVTLTNILVGPRGVTGLIDFGDMHHTAHVCDLAVALTAVLRNTPGQQPTGTWELAAAVLAGYQRHRPLTPQEVEVIGDLVVARLGLTLAISHRLSTAYPDNRAYVGQYEAGARRVLADLLDLGPGEVTRRLHLLAGTARTGGPVTRGSTGDATARMPQELCSSAAGG